MRKRRAKQGRGEICVGTSRRRKDRGNSRVRNFVEQRARSNYLNCLGLVQEDGGIRWKDDLGFGGAQETVRREFQMNLSTQKQRHSASIGNGMCHIPTQDSIEEESQRCNMSAKD